MGKSTAGRPAESTKSKEKKYIGVRKTPSGKYSAKITDPFTKTTRYLGSFSSAEEAARAFDTAAVNFRGPNAKTNFLQLAVNEDKTGVNLPLLEVGPVSVDDDHAQSQNVLPNVGQKSDCQPPNKNSARRSGMGKSKAVRPAESTKSKEKNYTGVRKTASGKYSAEIRDPFRKATHWIGSFTSAEEAARAFDTTAVKFRGPNAKTNFPQPAVSEENTGVNLPLIEADPVSADSIDNDDHAESQNVLQDVGQPLRGKKPTEDHQNAVEIDGAESSSQSRYKSMEIESADGVPIPDMAPVEYCRQVMQNNAYISDNFQRVIVRLFDSHPETFTTKCLRMDSSLLAFRLLGVAVLVSEIVNTDSSSLEMCIINGHLNSLEDIQKDGFNFSWLIKSLNYLRDPYMTTYRAQYRKNMEDLKIEEGKLRELAPKIKESAQVVEAVQESFAQAKRTHENNLMEKAKVESSISAMSNYQREISSDVAASIGEDFFTTRNLLFLLD